MDANGNGSKLVRFHGRAEELIGGLVDTVAAAKELFVALTAKAKSETRVEDEDIKKRKRELALKKLEIEEHRVAEAGMKAAADKLRAERSWQDAKNGHPPRPKQKHEKKNHQHHKPAKETAPTQGTKEGADAAPFNGIKGLRTLNLQPVSEEQEQTATTA